MSAPHRLAFLGARVLPLVALVPAMALVSALGLVLLLGAGAALAAPADPSPPREETAVPHDLPGETDNPSAAFEPVLVPDKAAHFKDPSIAALAGRILDGTADLRDRRAWYEISRLYAPFDTLPPAGWRQLALRDGEAISLAARARAAALDAAGEGPDGAVTGTGSQ